MLVVRRTVRGLGLTSSQLAEMMTATMQHQFLLSMNPSAVTATDNAAAAAAAAAAGIPTTPIPSPPSTNPQNCPCAVQVYGQRTNADMGTLNMAAQRCAADPAGFQQLIYAAGVSDQDVQNCIAGVDTTEWYKKPATWIIGGAIVLTGAFVIKAAL